MVNKLMPSSCRCPACRADNVAYLWVRTARRKISAERSVRDSVPVSTSVLAKAGAGTKALFKKLLSRS